MDSENESDADEWYGGGEETYLSPATAVYNPVHSGHADGAAAEDGIADAEEKAPADRPPCLISVDGVE